MVNIIYNITLILTIFWILLSIIKKYFTISYIQRNTIGMYLLIFIGLSISKYFFNNLWLSIPLIILIFIIHEFVWYILKINLTKELPEVTNNCYNWMNILQ